MKRKRANKQSLAAWLSVREYLEPMQRKVAAVIYMHGPITCDMIEQVTGMRHQTVSARITALRDACQITARGVKPTSSGRNAAAWEVASWR